MEHLDAAAAALEDAIGTVSEECCGHRDEYAIIERLKILGWKMERTTTRAWKCATCGDRVAHDGTRWWHLRPDTLAMYQAGHAAAPVLADTP